MASFKNLISNTSAQISSGGTITGDLIINGDLQVDGGGSLSFDEILEGTQVIDVTNTEAFLVRANSDGGDIFIVDTTNRDVTVSDTLILNPTISSGSETTLAFQRSGTNKWRFIQPSDDSYLKLYNDQATATQMYFKSDGKIGINEESPDQQLHVSSAGDTPLKLEHTDGADVHIELRNNAGAGYIGSSTDALVFHTTASATERFRISGIGLVTVSTSGADAYTPTAYNDVPSLTIKHTDGDTYYGNIRFTNSSGDYEKFFGSVQTSGNTSDLVFQGYDRGATAYKEYLRIKEDGKVGIGTNNPAQMLHIASATDAFIQLERVDTSVADDDVIGAIIIRGGESSQTDVARIRVHADEDWTSSSSPTKMIFETTPSGATADAVALTIDMAQDANFSGNINLSSGKVLSSIATGGVRLLNNNGTASAPNYTFFNDVDTGMYRAAADSIGLATGGTERMRITSDGNVEIGKQKGSTSTDTDVTIYGGEAGGAILGLYADNGDDNADKWQLVSRTNNNIALRSYSTGSWVYHLQLDSNSRISLSNNDSGTDNTVFGFMAGTALASGGVENTLVGDYAGTAITIGDYNTAVGKDALKTDDVGRHSTAIGYSALLLQNTASEGSANNTGVGVNVGAYNVTGTNNTWLGSNAGLGASGQSNSYNTGVGSDALKVVTTGQANTAVGYSAMAAETDGGDNVAVGQKALLALTGSTRNTVVGASAMRVIDDTADGLSDCTVVGAQAFYGNATNTTTGANGTTAIGAFSLKDLTTGDGNVALGYKSAEAMTTGARNVIIGYQAGDAMTIATRSVAIGYGALGAEDVGDRSIAIGFNALHSQNSDSDNETTGNVGVGVEAGYYNVTGVANTYVGYNSGKGTTSANNNYNTGLGWQSLLKIQDGGHNVSVGARSGEDLTTGNFNVFVGDYAGHATVDADKCIAIGHSALAANVTSAGDGSIAIGYEALLSLTSGARNTAVGYGSASRLTTGSDNTSLGYGAYLSQDAGHGNHLGGSHNTFIGSASGDGAYASTTAVESMTAVGSNSLGAALEGAASGSVAVGRNALGSLTSGQKSTAVGYYALANCDDGDNNTAIGWEALEANAGDSNTAVGTQALKACTGGLNTTLGYQAATALVSGTSNTVVGGRAFYAADGSETNSTIVGTDAGNAINHDDTDGNVIIGNDAGTGGGAALIDCVLIGYNAMNSTGNNPQTGTVAVGKNALTSLGAGIGSTAVGWDSGKSVTTGDYNTAFGYNTLGGNTGTALTGDRNTVIGASAGRDMQGATTNNVLVGDSAGILLTTGSYNTLVGTYAGDAITTSSNCTLIGRAAGSGINSTGANGTVCVGNDAGESITSGAANTAVGYKSLGANVDGSYNTAVGYEALYHFEADSTDHGDNTAVGNTAGKFISTGTQNTMIGNKAGLGITGTKLTGDGNTCVGASAGLELEGAAHSNTFVGKAAGNTTETGTGNSCLGFNTETSADTSTNQTVIGYNATGQADNSVTLGNADVTAVYMAQDKRATMLSGEIEVTQASDVNAVVAFIRTENSSNYSSSVLNVQGDRTTTNSTYNLANFTNAGTSKCIIRDSGNLENTNNSYGAISDEKLKQDIADASSQWDDIKAVKFRKFKFKDNVEDGFKLGVVAQEIEKISPHLVSEAIDRDEDGKDLGTTTKSVKYSVLQMKGLVALQEAMKRIEELEAKVEALESKG